ncbi:hypothetical protein [Leptothoe sp. PORK10 BA2]|uniref:hypothetical protein n=1 Tax=Leptothoe sp. PORK10 BA2 TaxID=3110254 RepID=UPI002B1E9C8F|nr:hypothetical protein [Leptothoe sp. PORK10 BA2]MEA5465884.1 hypothetical protein [Leptothoe sp. PORK10 BA2]
MSYNFDIVGVSPVWNFFKYQQYVEQSPNRSCAYLGSYDCTLDGFIKATALIYKKPDWDWDTVVSEMVNFWLNAGDRMSQWKQELAQAEETSLIVGRVANFQRLRSELEGLIAD